MDSLKYQGSIDANLLNVILLQRHAQQQQQLAPSPQAAQILQVAQSRATVARSTEPWVEITEQPKSRGLRFRYKCEGRSAGSIPAENSTNEKKIFPTIQIHKFDGSAAIVVVSCVTKDKPYYPHPHNLVGQDCRDGVCTVKVKDPKNPVVFSNIGIQCCKRHDIEDSLKTREKIRVDPYGTGYKNDDVNNIDLNSVRLCFQVFLPDANRKFTHIVPPVVSQPIIDKKSIHDLVICRLSRQSGYARGGDEVFLLCEKINKDDIQVRFYQETDDGVSWEAFGEFSSQDVHRQFAIVFTTPPYKDVNIKDSVQVFIQLRRPSDDEVGDPKPFQYIPQDPDPYGITMKRKRFPGVNLDRIPMSVMQEVKDDPESDVLACGTDVRNRLKKKAERGLQKKEKSMCDVSEEQALPQYSFVNTGADGNVTVMTLPAGYFDYATLAAANPGLDIVASAMSNAFPTTTDYPAHPASEQHLPSAEINAQTQAILQYLADNPGTLSSDSFTLASLSELSVSGNLDAVQDTVTIQDHEVTVESEPMD